jgi:hypothetical protein
MTVVTSSCRNTTSGIATLTINAATQISANPTNQTVCAGASATFNVTATGTGIFTYQWRKLKNIKEPFHQHTRSIQQNAGDAGNYDVVVTGICGSVTSTIASLTVNAVTVINTQPANQYLHWCSKYF